jgi:hypothetical protein
MTLHEEELGKMIASIVESLKMLGYSHVQFAEMYNKEKGHVILADSADGTVHFSIGVDTWEWKK